MVFFIFVVLLVLIICLGFKWHYSHWARRKIKGPSPLPLFGNMFETVIMKKHFGETYDEIYNSYKNAAYVGFYKFSTPSVLIRDLDLIKSVLVENFNHFSVNDFKIDEKLDPILSKNAFFAESDKWKLYRTQITPIFTAAKVKSVFPLVKETCDKLVEYVQSAPESKTEDGFEAKNLCSKFTIESVASCAFGLEAEAFTNENSTFVQTTKKVFETSTLQTIRLTLAVFIPILNKIVKLPFLPPEVATWLRAIIRQVVERRNAGENKTDFLQAILDNKQNLNLDEDTILGHSLLFLTDGYETSSTLICYCLYHLAVNPNVQNEVQYEVDGVLKRDNGQLTAEGVQSLNFLEKALYETLRLHSPGFSINKLCTKDFLLPPQYPDCPEGVLISPETPVIIPTYSIQRDPAYFPNPLKFDPERFNESEKQERHKFAFLGFGEGPRACVGSKFALLQSKAAIASLLSKFTVELTPKTVEPLSFSKQALLLYCEDGIWIRFVKRTN